MSNPYRGLPDHCFWSRAMTWPPPGQVDPVVRSAELTVQDKVATMGSCFAQHLARHIAASGLNYFVAEAAPPEMEAEAAKAAGFGVFSARYGNVYTVRQAVQLFDRAFGRFQPAEDVWPHKGGYVDAFRPRIEQTPHATPEAVRAAAADHLAQVRRVFEEADWLVFTLGLTEAWRSKTDGAVYPLAPGVAGGEFDDADHEFVNFSSAEVSADLDAFIRRVREVNPGVTLLLTVSPVPLAATHGPDHVWTATTYSKAVLRVAAGEAQGRHERVIYFPSYEIITSPAAGGRYYDDDLREVNMLGVRHVMRMFEKHFYGAEADGDALPAPPPEPPPASRVSTSDIVCDEAEIEASLRQSGFGAAA